MRQQAGPRICKVIELVGSSENSWEEAARNAAGNRLQEPQGAQDSREVDQLDMKVESGKVVAFRTRVKLSFTVRPCGPEELVRVLTGIS
ncbi:MAG: dodecin family protein [Candidatus Moduliflexus flocculans]|nr:dodecin family protein [Candidatus Moduliflexus flocculans]